MNTSMNRIAAKSRNGTTSETRSSPVVDGTVWDKSCRVLTLDRIALANELPARVVQPVVWQENEFELFRGACARRSVVTSWSHRVTQTNNPCSGGVRNYSGGTYLTQWI